MTIAEEDVKYRYEGNGSTDTFAFDSKAFTAADLVVEIITRATDALVETLTITTHYSVTIASDGTASIVTVSGKIPSATQDIQIRRALAQTQTTSLPTGSVFPAKSVENAIDRAVGLIQDMDERVSRSLKFAATSSTTTALLPEPTDDAVLCFDGTTGTFKVGETNTTLAAGATAAAASAAAALTSKNNAATSETNAATSETNAATSETNAEDWASKTDGIVVATDYSAKAYAIGGTGVTNTAGKGAAKEWAINAEDSTVDGTNYSAYHWAQKAQAFAVGNVLTMEEQSGTPSTPASGYSKLYFKTDNSLYRLDDGGTERQVGGAVTLETQTVSGAATIDLVTGWSGDYEKIEIIINGIMADDIKELLGRITTDGGSSWISTASYSREKTYIVGGTETHSTATGQTSWSLSEADVGNASGEGFAISVVFYKPSSSSLSTKMEWSCVYFDNSTALYRVKGAGAYTPLTAVNGFRLYNGGGSTFTATAVVKGYK